MLYKYDLFIAYALYIPLGIAWLFATYECIHKDVRTMTPIGQLIGWVWRERLFTLVCVHLVTTVLLGELGAVLTARIAPFAWGLWCLPGLTLRWRYQSRKIFNKEKN